MSTSRWRVRLRGREADLRCLAGGTWTGRAVVADDGAYYVDSDEWDALSEDQVFDVGVKVVAELSGAASLFLGAAVPMELDGVTTRQGGTHLKRFAVDSLIVGDEVSATGGTSGPANDPTLGTADAIAAAESDEQVAQVLRYIRSAPLDTRQVRLIGEIVRDSVGGFGVVEERGWAAKGAMGSIYDSVSDARGAGDDALHAVVNPSRKRRPPPPYSAADADRITRQVAKHWIEWIVAGRPT